MYNTIHYGHNCSTVVSGYVKITHRLDSHWTGTLTSWVKVLRLLEQATITDLLPTDILLIHLQLSLFYCHDNY